MAREAPPQPAHVLHGPAHHHEAENVEAEAPPHSERGTTQQGGPYHEDGEGSADSHAALHQLP